MRRERLINRQKQGDLGEASAIEWLLSRGAVVAIPFGHSPHFDLVAEIDDQVLRIQVKTSTQQTQTDAGETRYPVSLVTTGGNQSWSGVSKRIDTTRFELLFVLTVEGRRWLVPAHALEGRNGITFGGSKYAQYEIEPGSAIGSLVYGEGSSIDCARAGEYPSGQRMAAVNRPAQSFVGSNPTSPIANQASGVPLATDRPVKPTNYERKPGQRGEAVINQKRRLTIPQRPFFEAGFANAGRVRVRADGPGRLIVEQIELPEWARPEEAEPAA